MAWEGLEVQIDAIEADQAAATLASFIQSNVLNQPAGTYNLLYKMGNQESVIQIDTHDTLVKSYFVDKYHRPATLPVKDGIEKAFSEANKSNEFIDISRIKQIERMHAELARKSDESSPNYQVTQPALDNDQALIEIKQYRLSLKTAAQSRFGFFGSQPVSNKPIVTEEPDNTNQPGPK